MFNRIILISRGPEKSLVNLGQIAESLLFYDETKLFLKEGNLIQLLENIDSETLLTAIDNFGLELNFVDKHIFLAATPKGKFLQFGVGSVKTQNNVNDIVNTIIIKKYGANKKGKKISEKLIQSLKIYKHQENIVNQILNDLLDEKYINQGLLKLNFVPKQFLKIANYKFIRDNDTSYLLDFNKKASLDIKDQHGNVFGVPFLFNFFAEARQQINMSIELNSDISTSRISSDLMKIKSDVIINSLQKKENINLFQDKILENGFAVSETINANPELFKDFIKVLDKSKPFRNWLKNIPEDKDLLTEYYKAITTETWVDKLPAKGLRFAFFTGVGFITDIAITGGLGTAVGLGLGIGDTFILDKILKKELPSHFINQKIKKFIKK